MGANKLEEYLRSVSVVAQSQRSRRKLWGQDIPQELQRRQERLEKIAQVKERLKHGHKPELTRKKLKRGQIREREAKEKVQVANWEQATLAPEAGPKAKDQEFHDGARYASSGGGFEQAYNAHASVEWTRADVGNQSVKTPTISRK